MEYAKGEKFVSDFANRTITNLKIIEDSENGYEVTQLINSLLGLIVFPKERSAQNPDYKSLQEYVVIPGRNILSSEDLQRMLRNAISHSHIVFKLSNYKDRHETSEIESVVFVNCNYYEKKSPCDKTNDCNKCRLKSNSKEKPNFKMTIPVKELRRCVEILARDLGGNTQ